MDIRQQAVSAYHAKSLFAHQNWKRVNEEADRRVPIPKNPADPKLMREYQERRADIVGDTYRLVEEAHSDAMRVAVQKLVEYGYEIVSNAKDVNLSVGRIPPRFAESMVKEWVNKAYLYSESSKDFWTTESRIPRLDFDVANMTLENFLHENWLPEAKLVKWKERRRVEECVSWHAEVGGTAHLNASENTMFYIFIIQFDYWGLDDSIETHDVGLELIKEAKEFVYGKAISVNDVELISFENTTDLGVHDLSRLSRRKWAIVNPTRICWSCGGRLMEQVTADER